MRKGDVKSSGNLSFISKLDFGSNKLVIPFHINEKSPRSRGGFVCSFFNAIHVFVNAFNRFISAVYSFQSRERG